MRFMSLIPAYVLATASGAAAAAPLPATAALGTWWCFNIATDCGPAVGTFFPNGQYFEQSFGTADSDGHSGIERGTYTFTPDQTTADTGILSFTTLIDTNGGWGFNSQTLPIQITGDSITVLAGKMPTLYRLAANSPIQNGWARTAQTGDISVLAFLPTGKFMYGIQSAQSTVEYGDYSWNASTGVLALSNTLKSGPDRALSDLTNLHASISNSHLVVSSDQMQLDFSQTPVSSVPEPETSVTVLFGLVLITTIVRHSMRKNDA